MSVPPNFSGPMNDLFAKFWTDYFNALATGTPAPQAQPGSEVWKQMQRTFLDSMARYADEFMRSPQFLDAMKQTMDNALAFRRQMNDLMTQTLQNAQVPTQSDAREFAEQLHGLEKRVLERINRLEKQVAGLENAKSAGREQHRPEPPARAVVARPKRAARTSGPRMKK